MANYILFISETRLKESTAINLNVDVQLLLPFVKQAQKLYIETRLGTKLNDKLKALITAGTVGAPANAAYKTLLDDYIAEILPSMALFHAIPFLRFKVENGNIYSKTSETGTALSTEEAQHLRSEVQNTAEYYMERMVEYLRNNGTSFPEYTQNTGADVDPTSNAYYSGINVERSRQDDDFDCLRRQIYGA
ncbi:MAG: hypothetical protein Unbinned579contig1003_42 [Prokaryotic dsDNA virus sp.]|nr:MAG: hypothetical protein Unbinned579contig1003_42 [Prokaryotic dsDNA virus sp.]|tara:strand:+ start:9901 stop:10473 length:573 start_codon:yes stop_codon:yes gene_type:complete